MPFVRDNNLKVGDVCVFVLLKGQCISFEVVIFRANQNSKTSISQGECGIFVELKPLHVSLVACYVFTFACFSCTFHGWSFALIAAHEGPANDSDHSTLLKTIRPKQEENFSETTRFAEEENPKNQAESCDARNDETSVPNPRSFHSI